VFVIGGLLKWRAMSRRRAPVVAGSFMRRRMVMLMGGMEFGRDDEVVVPDGEVRVVRPVSIH
jgi:hypothetical protein